MSYSISLTHKMFRPNILSRPCREIHVRHVAPLNCRWTRLPHIIHRKLNSWPIYSIGAHKSISAVRKTALCTRRALVEKPSNRKTRLKTSIVCMTTHTTHNRAHVTNRFGAMRNSSARHHRDVPTIVDGTCAHVSLSIHTNPVALRTWKRPNQPPPTIRPLVSCAPGVCFMSSKQKAGQDVPIVIRPDSEDTIATNRHVDENNIIYRSLAIKIRFTSASHLGQSEFLDLPLFFSGGDELDSEFMLILREQCLVTI